MISKYKKRPYFDGKNMEDDDDCKLFVKLPDWFTIDTPLGKHNPDWAIIMNEEGKEKFRELKKISWVKPKDLLTNSVMVLIFTTIMTLLIFNITFSSILKFIT